MNPFANLQGSPGIGKTTCVMALAREMLGDSVKEGVLELNASDERGIDVVRGKIKMFAQHKVTLPPGRHKIVILDEADSMTSSAQQAMRRTMELYSSTTRFALACNNSSEIIEPIQSRCAILRFTKLSDSEILERLQDICEKEKVSYELPGLEAIIFTADGDLRSAINALQSTASGFDCVDQSSVFKVCDQCVSSYHNICLYMCPHTTLHRCVINHTPSSSRTSCTAASLATFTNHTTISRSCGRKATQRATSSRLSRASLATWTCQRRAS